MGVYYRGIKTTIYDAGFLLTLPQSLTLLITLGNSMRVR
jgi:hypothetical protein